SSRARRPEDGPQAGGTSWRVWGPDFDGELTDVGVEAFADHLGLRAPSPRTPEAEHVDDEPLRHPVLRLTVAVRDLGVDSPRLVNKRARAGSTGWPWSSRGGSP